MDEFVREAFVLLGVGLSIIALRWYVRLSTNGIRGTYPDDYLMIVAAIAYSVETYLAYSVGAFWKGLANNGMTDEQRRLLDPNSEEYRLRVNGSKTQVAGWSTYTFLLWTIKGAVCTSYLRLTQGLGYEKRIYVGFVIIVVTWLTVLFSILFGCRPMEKNWQIYPDPGNHCQPAISKIDIFVTVVLNIVTDIYLLSIPLPMLWGSSLRPLKKAGLMVLFSGGFFVMVAGILRCILIVTDPINGAQQAGSWAVRETFVAVVTSNLPMIMPLVTRFCRPIIGTIRTYTSPKKSKSAQTGDKPRSSVLDEMNSRRGMGPRTIHPIPDFTVNGSDEQLYGGPKNHEEEAQSLEMTDLHPDPEAGRGTGPGPGVIVKQTSVQISEMRKSHAGASGDERDMADYYLVRQLEQRGAERLGTSQGDKRQRTSGMNFGIGRGF